MSLFRGTAEAALHCAHQAATFSWWERPTFSLEGRLDRLPVRVSNEGLLRPRVARAQKSHSILLVFPHIALKGNRQTFLHCAHRTSTF